MITWPLKAKYRLPGRLLHRQFDPSEGTWVWQAGGQPSKQRTNSGKAKAVSIRPRMRAYWGSVSR